MAENEKQINSDDEFRISRMNNKAHEHEINTASVFAGLNDDAQKWKRYDRQFLKGTVQSAMEYTLYGKNIATVKYDGENGDYLENYWDKRYPAALRHCEKIDKFPFPDYCLMPDKNSDYFVLISFSEPCVIEKDKNYYDLFFALQFSLTEIVVNTELKANDFLEYHLENTFDKDVSRFQDFLENLCLKYNEFLKDKYEVVVKRFIENKISTQKEQKSGTEKTSINSDNRSKLNWLGSPSQLGYLFLELAEKGFIELPSNNGQGSYSRYAKICLDLFDLQSKTTLGNLEKEMNPNKNTLSIGNRAKFTIPELSEISKKVK